MRRAIALVWLLSLAQPVVAEEPAMPHLGDHLFVPMTAITEPFITTNVQLSVSLGRTVNTTTPLFSLIDSTIIGVTNSDQVLVGIGFRYQQVVQDWLAAWFSLGAGGRVGSSTNTLLSEGIIGAVGYNLGWMMQIHRSRSVLVSGSLSLGNNDATFINLVDWATGILEGEEIPLIRSRNSLRGSGGLHAAWGLNHRFGLIGSFFLNYGESFTGVGSNRWFTDLRLAMSYDAARDLRVPLGLAITGGHYENYEDTESGDGVWFWSARLAIQGRSDFSIGLDVTTSYYNSVDETDDLQFAQFTIDLRYFY